MRVGSRARHDTIRYLARARLAIRYFTAARPARYLTIYWFHGRAARTIFDDILVSRARVCEISPTHPPTHQISHHELCVWFRGDMIGWLLRCQRSRANCAERVLRSFARVSEMDGVVSRRNNHVLMRHAVCLVWLGTRFVSCQVKLWTFFDPFRCVFRFSLWGSRGQCGVFFILWIMQT